MKYFYFLFIFNLSLVYAQTPLETLLNNNWHLIDYDDGSELGFYDFLNNPELSEISLDFYMDNEALYYQTEVCRTKTGTVGEITEDGPVYNFQFGDFEIEGDECVETDSQIFETAYFQHIYDEFEYWFYFTENEDGSLYLTISSSSFCTAVFSNESLSNHEFSNKSIRFYPNPVKNNLTIENPDLKIDTIQVIDASGKAWIHQSISERKIQLDLGSLPKGIYFVHFESSGKTIQTEKILKN